MKSLLRPVLGPLVVFALAPVLGLAQTVISVNIAGGNQNAPGSGGGAGEGIVTENAGLGQLGNWNNAVGTSGTLANVLNSNGIATSTSFTWSTNNTWSTSSANGAGGDVDMMSGYLDNFHANGSITVAGLGAEYTSQGYDVLVYYQNDNSSNTAGFTAIDNLTNTDTRFGHQIRANNNWPLAGGTDGYVTSTETSSSTTFSANVVKLTGLSGSSFTLTGVAGTGQPSIRARPNAIQVIGTDIPGLADLENDPATGITSNSATLHGEVTDIGDAAPSVTIFYGDDDAGTDAPAWDASVNVPGTQNGTFSSAVSGLTAGATYFFRARATNSAGVSWAPTSATFQTLATAATVVNLAATEIMTSSAKIGANVTDTGGEIPLVTLHWGLTNGGTNAGSWTNTSLLGAQAAGATTTITGLQTGAQYFFRASATNGGGTSWAPSTVSFSTALPVPPTVVNRSADGISGTSANLRGEVTDIGFDSPTVTLFYGTSNGGTNPLSWDESLSLGTRTGSFSLFVSSLSPETNYFFTSRATNVAGTSWAPSSESFTTTDLLVSAIVINEIHYDHEPKTERGEFVEIYNPGDSPVNLEGWQFNGAIDFDFPPNTMIDANGFRVIAEDPAAMNVIFGVANALGPYTGKLSNAGERLELESNTGALIDEVDYGIGFPWPTGSRGDGSSMELINETLDNDLGSSWRASGAVVVGPQVTYVPAGQSWRYRKGTSEASNPTSAWRLTGFAEDASWLTGTTVIGYADGDDTTSLNDMEDNYASVFMRKQFNVSGAIPSQLLIRVYHDDGAIVWINGDEVARVNVDQGDITYEGIRASDPLGGAPGAAVINHEAAWTDVIYNGGLGTLVPGTNMVAVHALNGTLSSSDFSIDVEVKTPTPGSGSGGLPTPGAANSVFSPSAAPNIRQVTHLPEQPLSTDDVVLTAKVTDPDGVQSVTLTYQLVDPGNYVDKEDAAYETGWAPRPMVDDGSGDDLAAGDSIYTTTLPATLQVHRRLIRYRITVADTFGNSEQTPYADDESPNFAYFCYDGVPDWTASKRPGVLPNVTYPAAALESIPVYHLITKESDVILCQWTGPADGQYRYLGTWIYDGKVYDHMRYRIRGRASTRQVGKNKWKFNFNRARSLEARDNYGKKYDVAWDKINGLPGTNPWWRNNASTDGTMFCESLGFRMYQLAGGVGSNTHFYHFRIIDKAQEAPSDQYDGDFWGLYIAIEQPDVKFLEERNLPDGNIYNVHGGSGSTKRAQGATQVSDKSDLFAFQGLHSSGTSQAQWEANLELDDYFAFNAMNLAINNSDMRPQENINYYHNSETDKWHILPWDIDLTFEDAPHLGRGDTSAWENIYRCLQYPTINQAYENKVREILNLLLDNDQSAHVVDEFAGFVTQGGPNNIVEAGQAVWDYHPRKNKRGIWYANFNGALLPDRTFADLTQYTKDFLTVGGYGRSNLASKQLDSAIPNKPTIGYIGPAGFPTDGLTFRSSNFSDPQGSGTFGSMEWRVGEIRNPSTPNYLAGDRYLYELETFYQTDRLTSFQSPFTFPTVEVRPDRTYRARVRHLDNTGRASHWSEPVEFTATSPDLTPWTDNLMVTELNYNPLSADAGEIAQGWVTSDFEWVGLKNINITLTLDLTDIRFTKGIDFDFGPSAITSLGPGGFLLVVRNQAAFESRYGFGLPVAGEYMPDNLSNGGENVKVSFGAGAAIKEFAYLDVAPWPTSPDGFGPTLVLIDPDSAPDHTMAANWTASASTGGSPGAAEPSIDLASWKASAFTAAELANPALSGNLVDIDFDGMSTLLEYAFVGDPKAFDPDKLPSLVVVSEGGNDYIGLAFRRRVGAGDLTYDVQSSSNLVDWVVEGGVVLLSSVDNGDGSVTDTVRLPVTMASAVRAFLRLRVTQS
ncbi:MAG: CotH kinase family protein [Roseibacillus sp.]